MKDIGSLFGVTQDNSQIIVRNVRHLVVRKLEGRATLRLRDAVNASVHAYQRLEAQYDPFILA
jgi:hypothetical protein